MKFVDIAPAETDSYKQLLPTLRYYDLRFVSHKTQLCPHDRITAANFRVNELKWEERN
jgi:hypothetical protein